MIPSQVRKEFYRIIVINRRETSQNPKDLSNSKLNI